jgi:hypothetical protein
MGGFQRDDAVLCLPRGVRCAAATRPAAAAGNRASAHRRVLHACGGALGDCSPPHAGKVSPSAANHRSGHFHPGSAAAGDHEIKAKIDDCDRRLTQYRAALDAGADPASVARWITQTEAERAR